MMLTRVHTVALQVAYRHDEITLDDVASELAAHGFDCAEIAQWCNESLSLDNGLTAANF